MPEIKRFGSFKLLMFFQDENPPHVHIKGADFAAKIRISNGDLLRGVRYFAEGARTQSIVLCSRCNRVRFIDSIHLFSKTRHEEIRL